MNAYEPPPSGAVAAPLDETSTRKLYAGFWRRTGAAAIDGVILALPLALGVYLLSPAQIMTQAQTPPPPGPGYLVFLAIYLLVVIAYMAGLESSTRQATLGKQLLRIKVTDLELRRITFFRAVQRGWFYWLPLALVLIDTAAQVMVFALVSLIVALVSCFAVAFTERHQALHDITAGCLLINAPESRSTKGGA
ncbi:MAG: RDD family protein [Kiloniellales bacterium]